MDLTGLRSLPPFSQAEDKSIVYRLFTAPSCAIDSTCAPEFDFLQHAVVQITNPMTSNFCTGEGRGWVDPQMTFASFERACML